jgi:hypothetical protein
MVKKCIFKVITYDNDFIQIGLDFGTRNSRILKSKFGIFTTFMTQNENK